MRFNITASIHQGTAVIQTTEQIEADNTEHALFLFKTRHAENLVNIISFDATTEPERTRPDENFVRSPPHHSSGLDGSFSPPDPFSLG